MQPSAPIPWSSFGAIVALLAGLTTVSLDFIRSYRAETNVVKRPTAVTGHGYSLVGHHEIMIPLLAAAIIDLDSQS